MDRVRTTRRIIPTLLGLAAAGLLLLPSPAVAGETRDGRTDAQHVKAERYTYALAPVPHDPSADGGSKATGRVTVTRDGDRVTVKLRARGLSPGLVHAQHIHGVGENECPEKDRRDDRVDDGLIDTVEGLPDYGAVQVSLTTSGDTSADSTLAVDRFPVADRKGRVRYERTFTVGTDFPEQVAEKLERHHVVVHGIDVNRNGEYDAEAGTSALAPGLPLETEVPAADQLLSSPKVPESPPTARMCSPSWLLLTFADAV